jgi:hypothetical protein
MRGSNCIDSTRRIKRNDPLAQVSRRQLTAEEEACLDLIAPISSVYAANLARYDSLIAAVPTAQNEAMADLARANARVFVQSYRDACLKSPTEEARWRLRVPDSMSALRQAVATAVQIERRLRDGGLASDDEIVTAWRGISVAETNFKQLTASRPIQPADTPQASLYLFITPRGTPITYEATRNEWYLTPTIGVGPVDIIPTYGPINSGGSGTALTRLVIRDPTTMTFRVWKLNNRMPKMKIPESWISSEGTDFVIEPVQ